MAKGGYIGIGGKARKVKKVYIGISGKARKVKKVYIGIGDKARLLFSSEAKLLYKGLTSNLSENTVSNAYRNCANPKYGFVRTSSTIAYDSSLVASSVGTASLWTTQTSVGNYAVGDYQTTLQAIDTSLSVRNASSALKATRQGYNACASCSVPSYALIGPAGYSSSYYTDVEPYSSSLSKMTSFYVSHSTQYGAASTKNKGFFVGGNVGGSTNSLVDMIDDSLTRTSVDAMSIWRRNPRCIGTDTYAFMSGGYYNNYLNTADVYDNSGTRKTAVTFSSNQLTELTYGCEKCGEDFVIFYGGSYSSTALKTAKSFDMSLTAQDVTLDKYIYSMGTTHVGNKAVFAGGKASSSSGTRYASSSKEVRYFELE